MDIIGHRGNQEKFVENSYDGIIDCSVSSNIDGTEFDIRPTCDGDIVVIHNPKINGIRVIDLSVDDLKKMDFQTMRIDKLVQRFNNFKRDSKYFRDLYIMRGNEKTHIPLFEDVLKSFDSSKHMLVELKGLDGEYSSREQDIYEKRLVELLRQYDYKNRNIALEGYNLKALMRIKNQLPDLKVISLINRSGNFDSLDMGFDGSSVEHVIITNSLIERIINGEMKLYSWDDKTPIKHYVHINNILNYYRDEISDGRFDFTVINDFPEEARRRIK